MQIAHLEALLLRRALSIFQLTAASHARGVKAGVQLCQAGLQQGQSQVQVGAWNAQPAQEGASPVHCLHLQEVEDWTSRLRPTASRVARSQDGAY